MPRQKARDRTFGVRLRQAHKPGGNLNPKLELKPNLSFVIR
jgi:hypothetical protein